MECPYPVVWVTENRHGVPGCLRQVLQQYLDKTTEYTRVLMTFGICGQATLVLQTKEFKLVFPRVDDSTSLLLDSSARKAAYQRESPALFLTSGWLNSERGIERELEHLDKKYSKPRATRLQQQMYGEFRRLCLIDTGGYSLETILERRSTISKRLHLGNQISEGNLSLPKKLLTGPWGDDLVQIAEYSEVLASHGGPDHWP